MSVLVCYTIQGDEDDPETGVESSFRIDRPSAPRALTLFRLREAFPFIGTFHFRLKVPDNGGSSEYLWIDLNTDGDDIIELARNLGGLEGSNGSEPRIHVKVLPLEFGNPDDGDVEVEEDFYSDEGTAAEGGGGLGESWTEDDLVVGVSTVDVGSGGRGDGDDGMASRRKYSDEYGEEIGNGEGMRGTGRAGRSSGDMDRRYSEEDPEGDWKANVVTSASQGVKDLQKKSAHVAKTMGFGAKRLWQTVNKAVGGAQPPSPAASENLQELAAMLGSPFMATNRDHLADLGAVWACFFPDDEFEGADSARWKEIGFQETNVSAEFRGTGVLALKSMVYFCKNFERKAQQMCRTQAGKSVGSSYPWAIVANNLTLMLADVLELRANRFANSRRGHWGVFDRRAAYFEVFCMAFGVLDEAWTRRQATRQQFGQIIGYTKGCIQDVLETEPPNLKAFMAQAEEMNLVR